jgi:His-Xaa-Ser system protein HxsD
MYSELVLRKALYWLTEHCSWSLDADEVSWYVSFGDSELANQCEQRLDRLLNDFLLRERLDAATKCKRERIVASALDAIAKKLDGH